MRKLDLTSVQKEQIRHWKNKFKRKKQLALYRKMEVLDYAAKGLSNKEISELTDYTVQRVSGLIRIYLEMGISYFTEEHRKGGNRRILSLEEEAVIIEKFKKDAMNGKIVTLSEMKENYDKARGKVVPMSTFYYFLKRNEWRRVMPRGQHPKKASDEAIEVAKKLT